MALTAKQQRFVEEYLVDLNATQAAIRAGYSARTARQIGDENLSKPDIAAAIAERTAAISEKLGITQEQVLERWWQIATADPNELVQFRRTCCRYCHGVDHRFQWRDAEEFAAALAAFTRNSKTDDDEDPAELPEGAPTDEGGYGYHRLSDPSPDCPQCYGEGRATVHATDTRKLPDQARPLYAGVKQTRDGFEVKLQDQGKALENVARHLGMFNDKLKLENPDAIIAALISQGMSPKQAAETFRDELG
jgi:phage terminase small subunit